MPGPLQPACSKRKELMQASPLPWENIQWIKVDFMTTQDPRFNPFGAANTGSSCSTAGAGYHLLPWYLGYSRDRVLDLACPAGS